MPKPDESTFELRTYKALGDIELRAAGSSLVARGYAYVFNKYSQDLGGFVERIAPGAGAKSIGDHDIRALFNHDPNHILGRMGAGTLRMGEDGTGGWYEIDIPDTTLGRDLSESLKRGDISGSSFGFRLMPDGEDWSLSEQGFPVRTLNAFAIRDVGPVVFPAYVDTSAALKRLSRQRSLPFEEVVAAAEANELRSIVDHEVKTDSSETHTVKLSKPLRLHC